MHKLKNKHTGEVITTPYMAEVEEYLKSGDYEMSDNKYPYIGKCENGEVLFVGDSKGFVLSKSKTAWLDTIVGGCYADWCEPDFENITREYLTNTYGSCESQEHADFICKLAENHGFELNKGFSTLSECFYIAEKKYGFSSEYICKADGEKLINLPLPPKKKEMPETKPVYTKEMKKNGDIEVGMIYLNEDNQKCELIGINGKSFIGRFTELTVHYSHLDISLIDECKPIPTVEDELSEIWESEPDKHSIINAIIAKYNITPKDR